MARTKKLKETENWSRVFITPDLSPKEREKNRQLREELKRRHDDGEEGLIIRKGEIIRKGQSIREEVNPSPEQMHLFRDSQTHEFQS